MQTSQTAAGNSQFAMVAQFGQDPTLQPAAVPSNKEEPDSKRGRNSVPPRGSSAPPRGGKRPQSVGSQDSGSSRQARVPPWPMRSSSTSSRGSVWSNPGPETPEVPLSSVHAREAAVHHPRNRADDVLTETPGVPLFDVSASPPKVRLDADGWTIEKIVEQMENERDHFRRAIQKLESDIHIMDVSQQAQMADVTGIIKDAQMQSKEMKVLKNQIDAFHAADIYNDSLRQETEFMRAQIEVLQKVAQDHAERETKMGQYLEELNQLRPKEGQTIVQVFNAILQDCDTATEAVHWHLGVREATRRSNRWSSCRPSWHDVSGTTRLC